MKLLLAITFGFLFFLPLAGATHVALTAPQAAIIAQAGEPSGFAACNVGDEDRTATIADLGTGTYFILLGMTRGTSPNGADRAYLFLNETGSYGSGGSSTTLSVWRDGSIRDTINQETDLVHLRQHTNVSANTFWAIVQVTNTPRIASGSVPAASDTTSMVYFSPTGTVGELGRTSGDSCPSAGLNPITTPGPMLLIYDSTPPVVPSAPYLYVRGNLTGVRLNWNLPVDISGGLTGYKVYRGTTEESLSLLATIGTNRSYTDSTVEAGTRYYYCVKAYNLGGDGDCSNVESARLNTGMFGDDGSLWGEDGIEGMATNLQTTPGGVRSFVALPFLAGFLIIAWGLSLLIPRNIALGAGLSLGVLFTAAIGVYPWWGVAFAGMVIAGVLSLRRGNAAPGGV